eukprot:COSAG01_NODE_79684_length_128_cov_31.000000_1_plen_21_part_10
MHDRVYRFCNNAAVDQPTRMR